MKGDEERIREAGCEAYLSKLVAVAQFIKTIRRFLGCRP
jgi:two-component system cell cycle response regulator DivK